MASITRERGASSDANEDLSKNLGSTGAAFRRLCLEKLLAAHKAGSLQFFGDHAALANPNAFAADLAPLRHTDWVVYSKEPFGGREQVLRYMARYTHRVAISNSRLVAIDGGVSFKWKDYCVDGPARIKVMTLTHDEFIRRFLIHLLPAGFHRIHHYGLFAKSQREHNLARARQASQPEPSGAESIDAAGRNVLPQPCPCCGGRLIVIEVFTRGSSPRHHSTNSPAVIKLDTS